MPKKIFRHFTLIVANAQFDKRIDLHSFRPLFHRINLKISLIFAL